MSVISGTRRAMKELVDGTIRVQIDIDPQYRDEFLQNFSQIDMPVAIAPLKADFEAEKQQESTKIGGLTLLAVEWCKEPQFWVWISTLDSLQFVEDELDAKFFIQTTCEISSRKELNTNPKAAAIFQQEIRGPYMQWCQERMK